MMPPPPYDTKDSPRPSPRGLASPRAGDSSLDAFLGGASSSRQKYPGSQKEPTSPDDRRTCKSWNADAEAKIKVEAIEAQAAKIKTCCKKYPTSGSEGWGSSLRAKERFFAATPPSFQTLTSKTNTSWPEKLLAWQAGNLNYWASEYAYRNKDEPKGSIPLLSITKVSIDEGSPLDVFVKYDKGAGKDGESEVIRLRLNFSKADIAERFRYGLRTIRASL